MSNTITQPISIEYTDTTQSRHRVRFVPRSTGDYWRIESIWTGCRWRHRGRERVTDITVRSESDNDDE